jgi:6-phosphofructokinase 1
MKNIIVGQSGGPTAVINSSIVGVYKKAKELGYDHVYGMVNGIEGFIKGNFIDLDDYLKDKDNIELLRRTPSAFLGSCRYKLPKFESDPETYKRIFQLLEDNEIDTFLYTGGNDSMDTVKMLSDYAKDNNKPQRFMGVPKTIDNDLPITDHCPGYGSCAKYIATSIKEIIRDNESFNKSRLTVCIVEIMGRHAGWLAAAAALAKGDDCSGVDAIYLPETTFDLKEFLNLINDLKYKKDSIVIAVSEGVKTTDGKFVCELNDEDLAVDAFGHKQLSGCATTLCHIVAKETGLKTRAIELSTLQRAASHIASLTDIEEAEAVGARAVEEANKGNTGMMVTLKREQDNPYKCTTDVFDVHHIANAEKKIPLEWIDLENHQMKDEFITYARPLIMGELTPIFKDGVPTHLIRK